MWHVVKHPRNLAYNKLFQESLEAIVYIVHQNDLTDLF